MKKDYRELSEKILKYVGNKENIAYFSHCFTRLRFNIKDKGIVDENKIKLLDGVVGINWVGDQLQVIIGQEVEDVYTTICQIGGFKPAEKVNEMISEDMSSKNKFQLKDLLNDMIGAVTACITPILVVFVIGGLFKLAVVLLGSATFGFLPDDSNLIVLFTIVGDTCFRFFPVFVAYTAAKRFDASVPMALILACLLMHPLLTSIIESDMKFTVYGIPMIPATYANSFIPTLLITWALSKVEKFFKKVFPPVVRNLFYPICTILVMLPLALCVLGPIGSIFGSAITSFIIWLNTTIGPIATGLVGALFPLLIMTGMHHALNSAAYVEYAKNGFDSCIFSASYIMDYQLLSLCVAMLIKSKKAEDKALALNCIVTEAIGGISEPTIFGIMLKSKRNILYVLIGGFVGGFYIGLMKVKCFVLAPTGILSFLAYTGGSVGNLVHGLIACGLAFVIPFVLALVFGMEDMKKGEQ